MHRMVPAFLALAFVLAATAQSQKPTPPDTVSGNKAALRAKAISAIPPAMYEKWRKYGEWDYNQIGFSNRDYTQFNFGATASAAKIDKTAAIALAQAFRPSPDDLQSLANPDLDPNFKQHADDFEKLLKMAQQDSHVNRIAANYTWLDNDTKWPREDLGFSSARWDEYRALFKELSVPDGIVRTLDFPGAVFFIARSNGLCTGGSGAGYVYSVSPLSPNSSSPLKTLDFEARNNASRHYAYVFRTLKPDWYTFYEVDW